jgi:hypothetical protein
MDKKKIGRNDPCPCGSGKKYKQCHYEQDRAKDGGVKIYPETDPISPGIKRLYGIKDNNLGGR